MGHSRGKGGVLSPERSLTKICCVSVVSGVVDVEEAFEEEREVRIMVVDSRRQRWLKL